MGVALRAARPVDVVQRDPAVALEEPERLGHEALALGALGVRALPADRLAELLLDRGVGGETRRLVLAEACGAPRGAGGQLLCAEAGRVRQVVVH